MTPILSHSLQLSAKQPVAEAKLSLQLHCLYFIQCQKQNYRSCYIACTLSSARSKTIAPVILLVLYPVPEAELSLLLHRLYFSQWQKQNYRSNCIACTSAIGITPKSGMTN
jgi:hypothetical protein